MFIANFFPIGHFIVFCITMFLFVCVYFIARFEYYKMRSRCDCVNEMIRQGRPLIEVEKILKIHDNTASPI